MSRYSNWPPAKNPAHYERMPDYDDMTPAQRHAANLTIPVNVGDQIDWLDDYRRLHTGDTVAKVDGSIVVTKRGHCLLRVQIVPPPEQNPKTTPAQAVESLLNEEQQPPDVGIPFKPNDDGTGGFIYPMQQLLVVAAAYERLGYKNVGGHTSSTGRSIHMHKPGTGYDPILSATTQRRFFRGTFVSLVQAADWKPDWPKEIKSPKGDGHPDNMPLDVPGHEDDDSIP